MGAQRGRRLNASAATSSGERHQPSLVRGMSLLDATLLVVGGCLGSAIFLVPNDIASALPSPPLYLLIWVAGGVVTLMAAVSLAELGTMFPEAGGQYVYLREAFGDFSAYLFGWMVFVAGGTGGISTLVVAFARYLGKAFPVVRADAVIFTTPGFSIHATHISAQVWDFTRGDVVAVACIAVLTIVNVLGLRKAVVLQNVATWLKYGAVAVFVVFGFAVGKGHWSNFHVPQATSAAPGGLYAFMTSAGVAFIAVFWAYEGWEYATWASGEMKDPERTIPRSLTLGIVAIAAIYLSASAVYLYAMPTGLIAKQDTVAQTAAQILFSPAVAYWLSLVIALSCFGAASSNILAGARVIYAMGVDGVFFRRMATVHARYRTPSFALVAQGILAAAIALSGTYDQLFTYTTFGMILSYLACIGALFVLRVKRPDAARPYRCWGYPWVPALYGIAMAGWVINTVVQRPKEALSCLILLAVGVPLYVWCKRSS